MSAVTELYNAGLDILVQKGFLLPAKDYNVIAKMADELEAKINIPDYRTKYSYKDRFAMKRQYKVLVNQLREQKFYLDIYDEISQEVLAGMTEENLKELELTEQIVYNNFLRALSKIRDDLEDKLERSSRR